MFLKKSEIINTKKAFTLAEVLITMMIIGVIAAITIPAIVADTHEKEIKAKVKKTVSMFSQVMSYVELEGGDINMPVRDGNTAVVKEWFEKYLKKRLNIMKVCYDTSGCWHKGHTYKYDGKTPHEYSQKGKGIGGNTVIFQLNDGTLVNIDGYGKADIKNKLGITDATDDNLVIFFDVNGAKEPNTMGTDVFVMTYITGKGIVLPYDGQGTADCNKNGTGYSCINKYVDEI